MPNVLSPRDLVFRPDNMDETVPHTRLLVLHRNIHLTLTLKSLCMISLKGDDEVLINNRHRTFPATYGSLAIIDLFFVISF